jgi:hypothetical protein
MARPTRRGVGRTLDPLSEIFESLLRRDAHESSSAAERRREKQERVERERDNPETDTGNHL